MRRCPTIFAILFATLTAFGDEPLPPLTHAHAHNDYAHTHPLFDALEHGFPSVEADIFLVKGQLLVAHTVFDLNTNRTLQSLYLDPLRARAKKFGGRIYPNGDPTFYLLIDGKTDAKKTWPILRGVLAQYSNIITKFDGKNIEQKAVTVVLTGNRPRVELPKETNRLAGLDAQMSDLKKPNPNGIFLWMSEDWKHFFKWQGDGSIPANEKTLLLDTVAKAHERQMKVRFWDAPQSTNFWNELRRDGVDLLNADDLPGLENFLRQDPGGI